MSAEYQITLSDWDYIDIREALDAHADKLSDMEVALNHERFNDTLDPAILNALSMAENHYKSESERMYRLLDKIESAVHQAKGRAHVG